MPRISVNLRIISFLICLLILLAGWVGVASAQDEITETSATTASTESATPDAFSETQTTSRTTLGGLGIIASKLTAAPSAEVTSAVTTMDLETTSSEQTSTATLSFESDRTESATPTQGIEETLIPSPTGEVTETTEGIFATPTEFTSSSTVESPTSTESLSPEGTTESTTSIVEMTPSPSMFSITESLEATWAISSSLSTAESITESLEATATISSSSTSSVEPSLTPTIEPSLTPTIESMSPTPTLESLTPTPTLESTTTTTTTTTIPTLPIPSSAVVPIPRNMTQMTIYSDSGSALTCSSTVSPNCRMLSPGQTFDVICGSRDGVGKCLTFMLRSVGEGCVGAGQDGELKLSSCPGSGDGQVDRRDLKRVNVHGRQIEVPVSTRSWQHWLLVRDRSGGRRLLSAGLAASDSADRACLLRHKDTADPGVLAGSCYPSASSGLTTQFLVPLPGESGPVAIEQPSGPNIGLIVGCAIVGLLGLAGIVGLGFHFGRKKMERKWEVEKAENDAMKLSGTLSPVTPTSASSTRTAVDSSGVNTSQLQPFHHSTVQYSTSRAATSTAHRSASPERRSMVPTPTTAVNPIPAPASPTRPQPAALYPRPASAVAENEFVDLYVAPPNSRPPPSGLSVPSPLGLPLVTAPSPFDPRPAPTQSYVYVGSSHVPMLSTSPMAGLLPSTTSLPSTGYGGSLPSAGTSSGSQSYLLNYGTGYGQPNPGTGYGSGTAYGYR